MPITWEKALQAYEYRVDLREFSSARDYPCWFNENLPTGDRDETMLFEAHFREHAPEALEPWYEVVFWKMYSRDGGGGYRTREFIKQLGRRRATAQELWEACKEYVEARSRPALEGFKERLGFRYDRIAIVATFPAFVSPANLPMVDKNVIEWAQGNWQACADADPSGARLQRPRYDYATLYDFDFVASWVEWCQYTAEKLTCATDLKWRARDVEMAVFQASRGHLPLCPLPPLERLP